MNESTSGPSPMQPPASEIQPILDSEATKARQVNLDPVLLGLPIETVGQDNPLEVDRTKGFPHVLYHGTKVADFKLDDTRNHRNSGVGTGARSGAGLYAASEGVSSMFGSGEVIELVPHNANLIDLNSPQTGEPLSDEFKTAYLEDYTSGAPQRVQDRFPDVSPSVIADLWTKLSQVEGLVLKGDAHAMGIALRDSGAGDLSTCLQLTREVASQINTARVVSDLSDVSLRDLFAGYDDVNGESRLGEGIVLDIAPTIDFLTSRGVDGAKTAQKFKGPNGEEQGVVFWKLDNVGDKRTWEERAAQAPHDLGDAALVSEGVEVIDEANLTNLDKPYVLSRERSEAIAGTVNGKEALVPKEQMDAVVTLIQDRESTPLQIVKALADASPELAELLSATTGTMEGYRLHEHTQAVLGQFEKHYAAEVKNPKEFQLIRTALLLQDIGKSLAVARTGSKEVQTRYNRVVAKNLLSTVDPKLLSDAEKEIITSMIGQDILGSYLKGEIGRDEGQDMFEELIDSLPDELEGVVEGEEQVARMLKIMYMSDASAYTSEATYTKANGEEVHAQGSLDILFTKNQKGRVTLREPLRTRAKTLFENTESSPENIRNSPEAISRIKEDVLSAHEQHLDDVQRLLEAQGTDIGESTTKFEEQVKNFIAQLTQGARREGRALNPSETDRIRRMQETLQQQRELTEDIRFRDFEARAPSLVSRIRAQAAAEGRPLNSTEVAQIRNISKRITEHRAAKRTRVLRRANVPV